MKARVTGFDGGVRPSIKTNRELTLVIHSTENVIRHKVGLLNLAEELKNVSRACKVMGVSRDTFYRYRQAVEDGSALKMHLQACR